MSNAHLYRPAPARHTPHRFAVLLLIGLLLLMCAS